ncbi:hypothetical protein I314_06543 [Cryptococcus bacillisporus CA1873]|uniref:TECPR1-like DysF domain-containing protein n=1 Tax=Cryptococcus bacillisporus CA1873 TaxID=1296111 RepID=A0ABR5B228_CRYGA|nr:hypothetical protein I314_06543 [Cryptococcus bacillisporus CA1873]|eukprot:KIR57648.1 hypothetical protein I314_06543 [Cryptococcus gattii CA1873]
MSVPPYIASSVPPSAILIPSPSAADISASPTSSNAKPHLPFPPSSAPRGKPTSSTLGMSLPSLSSNVSDMLLSSLLPPNLPKLPSGGVRGIDGGGPRQLTTQREALSVPLLSNNFRRFVTRVGPVFWLQDRIEEVLYWRKPVWTWAWILTWAFICFQPRALLLLPSLSLIVLLLHIHERTHPVPSLIGIISPPPLATARVHPPSSTDQSSPDKPYTATATRDESGETVSVPVVPPKEVESGVDYFMNIQAIQNLMGLVSDGYDYLAPILSNLQSPNTSSPTSFPLTHTHIILLLLLPTLFLPLTPSWLIPYVILPLGLLPPLAFHPNLTPWLLSLPRHPSIRKTRSVLEKWVLTDKLPDKYSGSKISQVYVWENERLDPKLASSSASSTGPVPPTSWSARFLRQGDRRAWIKIADVAEGEECLWKSVDDTDLPNGDDESEVEAKVLALKDGWEWLPEDWKVDVNGLWSENGVDAEGWLYTDDSWQNPSPTPYTEPDTPANSSSIPGQSAQSVQTAKEKDMPGLGLRRVTRRRRWWKRVYEVGS